ncbi:hypothetical protein [Peribacillus loiseleuriae]|uniref:hypothetical protein n=1 Tax=Peribacillus loiseleuriae TaxID=1679170 RepID=UPI000A5135CF|nr:hypothetical protein [Peribacillus loiseleuriae]
MDKESVGSAFFGACYQLGTELLYKEDKTPAESQFLKRLDMIMNYKDSVRDEAECAQ